LIKKGRKELAGNKDVAVKQFLFMAGQMEHAARYSNSCSAQLSSDGFPQYKAQTRCVLNFRHRVKLKGNVIPGLK
jgi:hypothetical protein